MKFNRRKVELPDGVAVYHEEAKAAPGVDDFTMKASRLGVAFSGRLTLTTREELDHFAKALADAWIDHRSLVPKIISSH